jgi:hypothetical protein
MEGHNDKRSKPSDNEHPRGCLPDVKARRDCETNNPGDPNAQSNTKHPNWWILSIDFDDDVKLRCHIRPLCSLCELG